MTVTREQAAYLAPIIAACRPHGARHWQHTEIVSAIGKVGHLGLGDVILAAVRCAQDRHADSPFAFTVTTSPHWRERLGVPISAPNYYDPVTACDVCSRPAEVHREHDGHEFTAAAHAVTEAPKAADWADYARQAIGDAKAEPEPVAVVEHEPNPHVEALRAELPQEAK